MRGLIAATFTPMNERGDLALDRIPPIVDQLLAEGVQGLFVCGSTGEGLSLTKEERGAVAHAHVAAVRGRIPVIAQVGHNSLRVARELADHARQTGVDAIAVAPPCYFRPRTLEQLVQCVQEVAAAAPETPLYYYHVPELSGVDLPMPEFLQAAADRVPTLAGIKFSSRAVDRLQRCIEIAGGRFDLLFGCDEMLLAALAHGARGAVGSTYNLAAPLYLELIDSFERGDPRNARRCQGLANRMIDVHMRHGGLPAFKCTMAWIGRDAGPPRLPLPALDPGARKALRAELQEIGFFDWARPPAPAS